MGPKTRGILLLLALLSQRSCGKRSIGSDLTVTGFFGCRFSPVCLDEEICVDDALFGSCQNPGRPQGIDTHQYRLTPDYLQLTIGQLENLVRQDYAWNNLYTQCVVGNLLLSYRVGQDPDLTFCDPEQGESGEQGTETIDPETLTLLQTLLDEYEQNEVEKRENQNPEFVQVHKYMKQRKSSLPEQDVEKYLSSLSMRDLVELQDQLTEMKDELEQEEQEDDQQQDEQGDNQQQDQQEKRGDQELDVDQWPEPGQTPEWMKDEEDGYQSWPPALIGSDVTAADNEDMELTDPKEPEYDNQQYITPEEAKMIFDLIDGKELPPDLSEEELERLTMAVTDMLERVRGQHGVDTEDDTVDVNDLSGPGPLTAEQMSGGGMMNMNMNDDESQDAPEKKDVEKEHPDLTDEEKRKVPQVQVHKDVANAGPGYDVVSEEKPGGAQKQNEKEETEAEPTRAPKETLEPNVVTDSKSIYVDSRYVFVEASRSFKNEEEALRLLGNLQYKLRLRPGSFSDAKIHDDTIVFRVNENDRRLNASDVAQLAGKDKMGGNLMNDLQIVNSGTRNWADIRAVANSPKSKYLVLAFVVVGCVAGTVLAILAIYLVRRHTQNKQQFGKIGDPDSLEASKDYQDLCRQRMQSKASEKPEPLHAQGRVSSVASEQANSPSSRSSTSSWSEEPVVSNMDITTGHIILSYMEDHLQNKDRLDEEWEELSNYVPDLNQTEVASDPANTRKNRYADILPYDHSRVVLNSATNVLGSDYINASTITDHDPRNPAYIATQGPLPHTVADFWQTIWEQGSVVIVMLTKLTENGNTMCHRYWPEEGSDLYHIYEVHLVSEHIWCDDYLVRSFYLKNLQTNETRTVTQFHFLTWPDLSVPSSAKALLDFRRKVNKSYKGRSCPIVVHCSDGVGRTGIYCLLDMVLSRMSKGAKEIDIAATLEHIRDQRMNMVKTKEQFEFVLTAVADEVHAILKALPQ